MVKNNIFLDKSFQYRKNGVIGIIFSTLCDVIYENVPTLKPEYQF